MSVDDEDMSIYVEKGSKHGETIVYNGEGEQTPDAAAGDLRFRIAVLPHRRFVRDGDDLKLSVTISLLDALTGFHVEFSHLDGHKVDIAMQGVTQHGLVHTIKGEGMPVKGESGRFGDLHVDFKVKFPKTVTPEQAEGFRKLLK